MQSNSDNVVTKSTNGGMLCIIVVIIIMVLSIGITFAVTQREINQVPPDVNKSKGDTIRDQFNNYVARTWGDNIKPPAPAVAMYGASRSPSHVPSVPPAPASHTHRASFFPSRPMASSARPSIAPTTKPSPGPTIMSRAPTLFPTTKPTPTIKPSSGPMSHIPSVPPASSTFSSASPPPSTIAPYIPQVYQPSPDFIFGLNGYRVMFIWDSYPPDLLSQIPKSDNLSVNWPPDQGERYRLAAFPFVKTHGNILAVNVLIGIFGLVNSYTDVATFPAWLVNVYNPMWTLQNPFWKVPENKVDDTYRVHRCYEKKDGSRLFGDFQYIEVAHACYSPTAYPTCDDGGVWYYYAAGSGVWWNTGRTLVRCNKVDLATYLIARIGLSYHDADKPVNVVQLPANSDSNDFPPTMLDNTSMWAKSCNVIAFTLWPKLLKPANIKQGPNIEEFRTHIAKSGDAYDWKSAWTHAKKMMADLMDGMQGGTNIFFALQNIIKEILKSGDPNTFVPFIAFKSFLDENKASGAYRTLALCIVVSIALLFAAVVSFGFTLFAHAPWQITLILVVCGILGMLYTYYFQVNHSLDGLGWMTLAALKSKYSKKTIDIVEAIVEPSGTSMNDFQKACSGLAQTQMFDAIIEQFSALAGFDSYICHTQPNKSGTFTVEICDCTRVSLAGDLPPPSGQPQVELDFGGGICGTLKNASPSQAPVVDRQNFCCAITPLPYSKIAKLNITRSTDPKSPPYTIRVKTPDNKPPEDNAGNPLTLDFGVRGGLCLGVDDKCNSADPGEAPDAIYRRLSWYAECQSMTQFSKRLNPKQAAYLTKAELKAADKDMMKYELKACVCKNNENPPPLCLNCNDSTSHDLCSHESKTTGSIPSLVSYIGGSPMFTGARKGRT